MLLNFISMDIRVQNHASSNDSERKATFASNTLIEIPVYVFQVRSSSYLALPEVDGLLQDINQARNRSVTTFGMSPNGLCELIPPANDWGDCITLTEVSTLYCIRTFTHWCVSSHFIIAAFDSYYLPASILYIPAYLFESSVISDKLSTLNLTVPISRTP